MSLSPEDKKLILQSYRDFLSVFGDNSYKDLFRTYRSLAVTFEKSGAFSVQRYGIDSRILFLHTAKAMVHELNLGKVSLSALFFVLPVYYRSYSLEEVEKVAPEGTRELLESLIKASDLLLRSHTLSGEELQQFLLSVAEDARVIFILIADRICALRLAKSFPQEERERLAEEAFSVFVPLAHRLGLYQIKGEMEDLYLKYVSPESFYQIKQWLGETKRDREAYMTRFIEPLEKHLQEKAFPWSYTIKSRTKSIFSIHNKMKKKGVAFSDIYDLSAIRIIIDAPGESELEACWLVYSLVTDLYEPNIDRLRDWVTHPKANGYESLQITVWGPEDKYVEVQIRTSRMDSVAERGMAAHWRYKGILSQSDLDHSLLSVREAIEKRQDDPQEKKQLYEESIKVDSRSIFVFTPQGDLIRLPKGATVLDFAFAIHSNVGCRAVSGKINGHNAKLRDALHSGDTISIQTSRNQKPNIDWISFVTTSKAKNKIRQEIHKQQESGLQAAKELLQRRFKNRKLVYEEGVFMQLLRKMGYKGNMDFFIDLSEEKISIASFLDRYQELFEELQEPQEVERNLSLPKPKQTTKKTAEGKDAKDIIVVSSELDNVSYSLAKCCNPTLGDDIYAYPSKGGLRIHTIQCPNSIDILGRHGDRVLPARWKGTPEGASTYSLSVEALEQPDLISHIQSLCTKTSGVEFLSESSSVHQGVWSATFLLSTPQKNHLFAIVSKINALKGVRSAQIDSSSKE